MFRRMRMLLHVLAVGGVLTAAVKAQLLVARVPQTDADDCGVGYQYRSPPEELLCKANITLTRLNCLVAFPSSTPINTRVEVQWYWRSLEDAAAGSNTAIKVNGSHFLTVNTACDRGTSCPDAMYNLTVHISQLEIEDFSSPHQGDYMCRLLVINETSGELQQALHPSACVRLMVAPGINQNCEDIGERTAWRCADTPQTRECPQVFPQYPVILPSSSVAQKSSSTSVISSFQSTMSLSADSTTTVSFPPIPSSVVVSILFGHNTPTSTKPGTQDKIATTLYVSVSLGALIILIIGVVSTTIIIIILGMRHMNKRSTQNHTNNGRDPTLVLEEKSSSVNGEAVHNEGTTSNGSAKEVKRNSSIYYSKPVRVTEQSKVDPKDHKYANPIFPNREDQRGSAVYSYAYQHMHHPGGSKGVEEAQNGDQNTGDDSYIHMNPSVDKATNPTPEDGEYEQMILNKETPSVPSPYIEPVQSLAKSD